MSTVLTSLMCLLHDEEKFAEANQTLSENIWDDRFCVNQNEYYYVKDFLYDANAKISEWQLFAVVRNPLERFLSAFVHLCVNDNHNCFYCNSSFSCLIERAYYQAYGFAEGKDIVRLHVDGHFFPQNWQCQFSEYFGNYKIIHYKSSASQDFDKMVSQIVEILKSRQSIPKKTIKSIRKQLLEKHLTS
uniref:Sulfotransferase family protein n=1 Tax=Panagrolaimus sp. ES5 TaxID=591445 RepID=A0AC34G981_9BILA